MLGVTDRDREEIRIGRNRAIGARYAMLLFWGPLWGRVARYVVVGLVALWLIAKAHTVWVGGLGATLTGVWPILLAAAACVAAAFLWLRSTSTPRRRRHHRRRRRY